MRYSFIADHSNTVCDSYCVLTRHKIYERALQMSFLVGYDEPKLHLKSKTDKNFIA